MPENLRLVAEALDAFLSQRRDQPGADRSAVRWIEGAGVGQTARIALRVALTGFRRPKSPGRPELPFTLAARRVAEGLRVEAVAREVEAATGQRIRDSFRYQARTVRQAANEAGIEWPRWAPGEALRAGAEVLGVLVTSSPVVERVCGERKDEYLLRPTPDAWPLLRLFLRARDPVLWPVDTPTTEKPPSWKQRDRNPLPLVRGRRDYDRLELPRIRRALDRVQSAGWRINEPILDLAKSVWEAGGGRYGLPDKATARPFERARVEMTLHMADELRGSVFYFPHNCDWRGRIRAASDFLTPQDPVARALLVFDQGKPLGEVGSYWLAVHGANCFGVGGTFDGRAAWTEEHDSELDELASTRSLAGAAFIREWRAYKETGPEYVSHLPVALDASCNRLQHFAALFRDEVTAAAVNLVPSDAPGDLYAQLADRVSWPTDPVWEETVGGPVRFDRDEVERPVMAFGYGTTESGLQERIVEAVCDAGGHAPISPAAAGDDSPLWTAAGRVARGFFVALREVAPRVATGRDRLQGVARTIAKRGESVWWRVPVAGFPVRQIGPEYWRRRKRRVLVADIRIIEREFIDPRTPEIRKHVESIAPNVIDSLDAAALALTILGAPVSSWGVVHDSYHVLPADVPALQEAARTAFWRLYNRPVLEGLWEQFRTQAPSVPEPPEVGAYDIGDVLHATYFLG